MNDTKTRKNHEDEVEEYMDTKLAIYVGNCPSPLYVPLLTKADAISEF